MRQEQWNKQCGCGNYIPDEYEVCDSCLLKRYGLLWKGKYDSSNPDCVGNPSYPEELVVKALRKAEQNESN